MKKRITLLAALAAVVLLAAACTPKIKNAAPASAVSAPALVVSGTADAAWTLADLQALPQNEAEYTNKKDETMVYSGVSFADLFTSASVESYTAATLLAADEYSIDLEQATLDGCAECIVAILDDGSLRSVMPGMQGAVQVRDLVEIIIK